jgi:hypothetical protein
MSPTGYAALSTSGGRSVVVALPVVAGSIVVAVTVVGLEPMVLTPMVARRIVAATPSQCDSWSSNRGHRHHRNRRVHWSDGPIGARPAVGWANLPGEGPEPVSGRQSAAECGPGWASATRPAFRAWGVPSLCQQEHPYRNRSAAGTIAAWRSALRRWRSPARVAGAAHDLSCGEANADQRPAAARGSDKRLPGLPGSLTCPWQSIAVIFRGGLVS